MKKNWFIYILTLIGSFVFFLYYQMWLSWYVLVLVLLVPVFALVLAILARSGRTVRFNAPASVKIGDKKNMEMRLGGKKWAVFSFMTITIRITEMMTGKSERIRILGYESSATLIPVKTEHCGTFRYEVEKIKVYDCFGLFGFSGKKKAASEVTVRPVPVMPEVLPDMNGFKAKNLRPATTPYSEIYDVREYVIGDPIKNIHWKASAKRDTLLVKEPQEECSGHARVFMALSHDQEKLDKNLGEMLFTSNYFLEHELPHKIRVLPPLKREVAFDIESSRDLEMAVLRILHMRIPTEEVEDA